MRRVHRLGVDSKAFRESKFFMRTLDLVRFACVIQSFQSCLAVLPDGLLRVRGGSSSKETLSCSSAAFGPLLVRIRNNYDDAYARLFLTRDRLSFCYVTAVSAAGKEAVAMDVPTCGARGWMF